NPAVNPQVANEFSTAGFRVGHTLLSSSLERFEEDGTVSPGGHLSLRDSFFNPQIVKDDGIERILRGLAVGKSEKIDNFVIDDVRNFLFGEPAPVGGFDLPSLNIQRGRDHGLPSYNIVRNAYDLPTVDSFFDITYETDIDLANKLKTAYGVNVDGSDNVNAVDVWVGGISEPPVLDGMVGPTFAKTLKDQFERVRDGDRFWYQNRNDLSDFQNQMIENTRLSDIILRNTDIDSIQQNVFLAMDRTDNDLDNDGTPDATDTDDDGDGISDTIDTMPTVYSPSFSDVFLGGTTYGHIENRGGKAVTIIDEPDPAGVRVSAVGGGAPATVSSCGFEGTISFDSGDMAVITCGSVTIQVLSGSVDISYMMSGITVTAEMFSGTIMINPDPGSVSITNLSGDTIIMVMIDGVQTEIGPGVTYEFPVQPDNSQEIGGEIIPIETTTLLLAGAQTSAVWMVPLLAGAVGVAAIYIKKRKN
ncbi:MAG TPA: peroxidase family protein, partial [Nitrosopumilaceae archaeon]|nr:peroxidase family protein [Nitrosopumilaceae archaeon]